MVILVFGYEELAMMIFVGSVGGWVTSVSPR